MYTIVYTGQFKKDLKRIGKQNIKDLQLAKQVVNLLQKGGHSRIPKKMKPHRLKGDYKNNWECHIKPDLLIIWIQFESPKIIRLVRIGSHSELFK